MAAAVKKFFISASTISRPPKQGGRLTDAQNALLEEAKLSSFHAGFKLAWGIAKELEAGGLYSFAQEDEECARRLAEQSEGR